jgi:hypothetical protein
MGNGGMIAIIQALRMHPSCSKLQEFGLGALRDIIVQHSDYQVIFEASDSCWLMQLTLSSQYLVVGTHRLSRSRSDQRRTPLKSKQYHGMVMLLLQSTVCALITAEGFFRCADSY